MSETKKKSLGLGLIIDEIEWACFKGSLFCTALMMVFISIDALGRYLLNRPIIGTVEITEEYLMVALVFLSLSDTYRKGGHVRITMFLKLIPLCIREPISILFNLLALGFFGFLTYGGWNIFIRAIRVGEFSSCILHYPLAPAYFLIPLGSGLLCIRLIQDTIGYLRGKKD